MDRCSTWNIAGAWRGRRPGRSAGGMFHVEHLGWAVPSEPRRVFHVEHHSGRMPRGMFHVEHRPEDARTSAPRGMSDSDASMDTPLRGGCETQQKANRRWVAPRSLELEWGVTPGGAIEQQIRGMFGRPGGEQRGTRSPLRRGRVAGQGQRAILRRLRSRGSLFGSLAARAAAASSHRCEWSRAQRSRCAVGAGRDRKGIVGRA